MRAALALLCFLVACTDDSNDDGAYLDLDVTSDVPFTALFVFEPGATMSGFGILTPELQAAGMPAPGKSVVVTTDDAQGIGNGQLRTTYTMHRWDLGGGPSHLDVLAVVAQPDGSLVPVAFAASGHFDYAPKDGAATEASATLSLAKLDAPAELWGVGTSCVRMVDDTSGTTTYLVQANDIDCDGILDENDCQPEAFCDARNPTELAACTRGMGGC